MGGFKSAVTRRINEYHHGKRVWQTRFYDHIIRNDQEFDQIKKYIMANPENWEKDKFI
jgi:REP element-mobilizing transposase RayT